jgi:phage terminase small subunit
VALTVLEQRFCEEYPVDWNKAGAARRAGSTAKNATQAANEFLKKPEVQAHIEHIKRRLREKAELSAGLVLEDLRDIVVADPRDLIELRRDCCRFCYGKDHRYQETPAQRHARKTQYDQAQFTMGAKEWKNMAPFDELGGIGFNPKLPPVEDCPECFGDGEEKIIAKDQRYLSPAAVKLLRGTKITNQGLEIKMGDPDKSRDKLGAHFGLWADKDDSDKSAVNITITGGLPQD